MFAKSSQTHLTTTFSDLNSNVIRMTDYSIISISFAQNKQATSDDVIHLKQLEGKHQNISYDHKLHCTMQTDLLYFDLQLKICQLAPCGWTKWQTGFELELQLTLMAYWSIVHLYFKCTERIEPDGASPLNLLPTNCNVAEETGVEFHTCATQKNHLTSV